MYLHFFRLIYRKRFKKLGVKSYLYDPLAINGADNISIGDGVYIGYKSWLAAVAHTGSVTCKLEIGNGSNIGNYNHIYATQSIIIGKDVLTADKVYISDNLHSYQDIKLPIIKQPIKQLRVVIIGDGAWLGENVCIIGANVGRNSVIGANAVVTKDIPDYCIAVGSPAYVIKKFCFERQQWIKTNKRGNFIE